MSIQQLVILAAVAMTILAMSRVVRVHFGRTPHLQGRGSRLFVIGLLFALPIVVLALVGPAVGPDRLVGVAWVMPYTIALVAIAIVLRLLALIVRYVAPVAARPFLLLVLTGGEADPYDVPFDPPITAKLAESVGLVDRANAAFPRGVGFPTQIDRSGFRGDWEALDGATRSLEDRIAADFRLGLAVASGARVTAADARSRLDTLRRLAVDQGQAWAP
jgi:hypothetical protein